MRRRALLRGSALVVGATLVWHLCNFAFNASSARVLGPAKYGTLAASISLLWLLNPVFISVQTIASREATTLGDRGLWGDLRLKARRNGGMLVAGAVVLGVVGVLASPQVARFLHLGSVMPVAILSASIPLAVVAHLQRGLLQGARRFASFAASLVAEAGTKTVCVFGLLLLVAWHDPSAGMVAIAVGLAGGIGANAVLIRRLPHTAPTNTTTSAAFGYASITLVTMVLLSLLLSADTLAAKRYLSPELAGLYAGVALTGKITYFATSAVGAFMFPLFSAQHERGNRGRQGLLLTLGTLAAICLPIIAVLFVAPRLVVAPLLGAHYTAAAHYAGWAGVAFAGYAMLYMISLYLLAQRRWVIVPVLAAGVICQLTALYSLHSSVQDIIGVLIATFGITGLVLVAFALAPGRVPTSVGHPTTIIDLSREPSVP